jgi:hypothetical protein
MQINQSSFAPSINGSGKEIKFSLTLNLARLPLTLNFEPWTKLPYRGEGIKM